MESIDKSKYRNLISAITPELRSSRQFSRKLFFKLLIRVQFPWKTRSRKRALGNVLLGTSIKLKVVMFSSNKAPRIWYFLWLWYSDALLDEKKDRVICFGWTQIDFSFPAFYVTRIKKYTTSSAKKWYLFTLLTTYNAEKELDCLNSNKSSWEGSIGVWDLWWFAGEYSSMSRRNLSENSLRKTRNVSLWLAKHSHCETEYLKKGVASTSLWS